NGKLGRMDRPRTTDATWSPLEAIPVFFIAIGMATLARVALLNVRNFCGGRAVIEALVGEIAFAASVLFWIRYVNRGSLAVLGRSTQPGRDVLLGIGVGIGLVFAGGATLYLVREVVSVVTGQTPEQPEQVVACVRGAALAFMAPVVVVVAPIGEEIFFRGFLHKGLRRRFPMWAAAVLSSLLFGLVHYYPLLIPALFVVGLGLALLYERRQSLLAPVVAHAAFNIIGFIAIALGRQ
ncbi:MAG: CPBP family intramembrane metalloprotease, partial [Actinomycetota bacterium]|nr:CPBP family intramembrane metalloprotease [Actinomycetota bacterium]